MTKRKRIRRAKNKVEGSFQGGSLIKADTFAEAPQAAHHLNSVIIPRSTIFTAELEEVIEIIAKDRVYRAMLAAMGRRLLLSQIDSAHEPSVIIESQRGAD